MVETIVMGKTIESIGKGACYVVGAGAMAAGAYVAWWTFEATFGWLDKAGDWWSVRKSNVAGVWTNPDENPHTNIFGLPGWGIIEGVL